MGFYAALCLNDLNDLNGQDSQLSYSAKQVTCADDSSKSMCAYTWQDCRLFFLSQFSFLVQIPFVEFFVTEMLPSLSIIQESSGTITSSFIPILNGLNHDTWWPLPFWAQRFRKYAWREFRSYSVETKHCLLLVRSWGKGNRSLEQVSICQHLTPL